MVSRMRKTVILVSVIILSTVRFGAQGGILEDYSSAFCLKAPNLSKCPSPPTFDLVDISAFAGKWYEIGSTAQFKFNHEAGLACMTTNYTVMTSASFWGPKTTNFSVVDKGLKAIGSLGTFGVKQINTYAKGLCQNARDICNLLSANSNIDKALSSMSTVVGKIFLLHGVEATTLKQAKTAIGSAIKAINVALISLSKNVTQIQYVTAKLSQADGESKDKAGELINVTMKAGNVEKDIQAAVSAIADARGQIIRVAAKLVLVGGVDSAIKAVPDLGNAVFSLAAAENAILALAGQMRLTSIGISAMSGLISLDTTKPEGYASGVPFSAVQNSSYAGRFDASYLSTKTPYLVLSVDGFPVMGYNAALLYTCSDGVAGSRYNQGLFIIGRAPTLAQSVIDRFMSVANYHGISTDCDDPFLYTVQTAEMCTNTSYILQ